MLELTIPIRVSWDLPLTEIPDAAIATDLAKSGVLSLELWDPAPRLRPSTLTVIERFRKSRATRVSLTTRANAVNETSVERLTQLGLAELLLHATSVADIERSLADGEFERLAPAAKTVGVSVQLTSANLLTLPAILRVLVERGIGLLVLPIQRADQVDVDRYWQHGELAALADELEGVRHGATRVVVHDPFLWSVLFPRVPPHEVGCQAANTLMHITPEGDLWPCPIMPLSLGNLSHHGVEALLRSEAKKALRESIRTDPEECGGCPEQTRCRGGCRGRAVVVHGGLHKRDPACDL